MSQGFQGSSSDPKSNSAPKAYRLYQAPDRSLDDREPETDSVNFRAFVFLYGALDPCVLSISSALQGFGLI